MQNLPPRPKPAQLPAWVQHADKAVMALRVERLYGQNPRKGMRLGVAEETPELVEGQPPRGGHGAQGEPATALPSADETPAAGAWDYGRRFDIARRRGVSATRRDGSKSTRENDRQAGAAEEFALRWLGLPALGVLPTPGDGGTDGILRGRRLEIRHLGMMADGTPRGYGHLIVNTVEPHRWADIYVVVQGSIETRFAIAGWLPHEELIARPQRDFGYGPCFCCSVSELRPGIELMS